MKACSPASVLCLAVLFILANNLFSQTLKPGEADYDKACLLYGDEPWGEGVPAKVIRLMMKSAAKDYPPACYRMGILTSIGYGVERNEEKAIEWYYKAVAKEYIPAIQDLSQLLEPSNIKEAKRLALLAETILLKKVNRGDAEAMFELAEAYSFFWQFFDEAKAVAMYEKAADHGNVEAMIKSVEASLTSTEGEDFEKATKYAEAAAEKNSGEGLAQLGLAMAITFPVNQKNLDRGIKYCERAAQMGETGGIIRIAEFLVTGKEVVFDDDDFINAKSIDGKRGIAILSKQAKNKERLAQRAMGYVFQHGVFVPDDQVKASKYFLMAAEAGDLVSMRKMIERYKNGIGVDKSESKSAHWQAVFDEAS